MKRLLFAVLFFLGLQHAALAASCGSYPFTLQNNTTADATQVMANFNNVRNCVLNNAAGSGVNTDITALTGLTTPLSPAQGGTPVFIGGTSTGSADAQVIATTTPIGFSLTSGWRLTFVAGFTNLTTTPTLNVNSSGATVIKKVGASGLEALAIGDIIAGNVVEAIYDGTEYVLLTSPVPQFNTRTTLASAATTDLGTIQSHNVSISGTTTITSFGSSATTTNPIFFLNFAGALTLTHSSPALILPGSANIVTAAGDQAIAQYLGSGNWRVISYTPATGNSAIPTIPLCGANRLVMSTASTTTITYSADSALLLSSSNVPKTHNSISGTISITAGAVIDGIQTARAANTWYDIYLLSNGSTVGGFAVPSASALSAPSGYIFSCRLGSFPTDGSTNLYNVLVQGNHLQYTVQSAGNTTQPPNIFNGTVGTYSLTTPTWSAQTVRATSGFSAPACPSRATRIEMLATNQWNGGGSAQIQVAPNANYGGSNTTKPAICQIDSAVLSRFSTICAVNLEASTIQAASSGVGAGLSTLGCYEPINAN